MVKKSATTTERKVPTEAPWPANTDGWSRAEKIQLNNNMRAAGLKWAEIRAVTGLNHALSELEYMRFVYLASNDLLPFTPATVRELRDDFGYSWGEIMVRVGRTEGAVRAAYKEATGKLSEGTRNGRGGRWLNNDAELYADTLKPTGTHIPVAYGRTLARKAAAEQRLGNLTPAELKAYAEDRGVQVKGKAPAAILKAVLADMGYADEAAPKAKRASKKAVAA